MSNGRMKGMNAGPGATGAVVLQDTDAIQREMSRLLESMYPTDGELHGAFRFATLVQQAVRSVGDPQTEDEWMRALAVVGDMAAKHATQIIALAIGKGLVEVAGKEIGN